MRPLVRREVDGSDAFSAGNVENIDGAAAICHHGRLAAVGRDGDLMRHVAGSGPS